MKLLVAKANLLIKIDILGSSNQSGSFKLRVPVDTLLICSSVPGWVIALPLPEVRLIIARPASRLRLLKIVILVGVKGVSGECVRV